MSRPEIELRLRFADTATLVAFLTRPPAGVWVVVEDSTGSSADLHRKNPQRPDARHGQDLLPRRLWTKDEEEGLIDLYTSGKHDLSEIARRMNRTYSAVYSRLAKLGALDPRKENER